MALALACSLHRMPQQSIGVQQTVSTMATYNSSLPETRLPNPSRFHLTLCHCFCDYVKVVVISEFRSDMSDNFLQGIRYAAPPVGERRWRAPEARNDCDATARVPATQYGDKCMQWNADGTDVIGTPHAQ